MRNGLLVVHALHGWIYSNKIYVSGCKGSHLCAVYMEKMDDVSCVIWDSYGIKESSMVTLSYIALVLGYPLETFTQLHLAGYE